MEYVSLCVTIDIYSALANSLSCDNSEHRASFSYSNISRVSSLDVFFSLKCVLVMVLRDKNKTFTNVLRERKLQEDCA